jgi:hypothetical protein
MADVARYRHEIFVEALGWRLQSASALKYDQFDREDTVQFSSLISADLLSTSLEHATSQGAKHLNSGRSLQIRAFEYSPGYGGD